MCFDASSSKCVVFQQLRRKDTLSLVNVAALRYGEEESLRPRRFIKAEFHVITSASTPGNAANLIVVVNHTRSGSGAMKIKSGPAGLKFKQDARISVPVGDVSNETR